MANNEAADKAIQKLTIIKELSSYPETKQIAKVIIEYIQDSKKSELGFSANKDDNGK